MISNYCVGECRHCANSRAAGCAKIAVAFLILIGYFTVMIRESASAAIRRAEIEIAKLATDAAGQRDYDTAEVLLGIARNLAGTAESLASSRPPAGGNGVAGV